MWRNPRQRSAGLPGRGKGSHQDITSLIEAVFGAEIAYQAAPAARDAARQAVIRTLDEADVPQSAIGDLPGLSHQRVNQLIRAGQLL